MNDFQKAFALLERVNKAANEAIQGKDLEINQAYFRSIMTPQVAKSLLMIIETVIYDIADESVCVLPEHQDEQHECKWLLSILARAYESTKHIKDYG